MRREKHGCQAALRTTGSLEKLGKRTSSRSSLEGDWSAHHDHFHCRRRLGVSGLGVGEEVRRNRDIFYLKEEG